MTPLCPPMTGTTTELDSDKSPMISDTNVEARTTSRVVTPKSLRGTDVTNVRKKETSPYFLGSKTPCFLKTSATMGTVELTGLEITSTKALGATVAMPVARSLTMPALIYRTFNKVVPVSIIKCYHLEKIISDPNISAIWDSSGAN